MGKGKSKGNNKSNKESSRKKEIVASSIPSTSGREKKSNEGVTDDPRFAFVERDPRFMKAKNDTHKVKLDSRFSELLTNKDFTNSASVDKYGRTVKDRRAEVQLKRLYKLEDGDDDDDDDKEEVKSKSKKETKSKSKTKSKITDPRFARVEEFESDSDEEQDSDDSDDDDQENDATAAAAKSIGKLDLARGEGIESSSDESSDESEIEWGNPDDDDEGIDLHVDPDSIPRGDETRRIACVNLDWENIRAVDLLVAFSAFKPDGGAIKSVTIYPSEFGKERMKKESVEGPPQEVFGGSKKGKEVESGSEEDSESEVDLVAQQVEEGSEFNQTALRKYELEKLKYYYAVVECNSVATARSIYEKCDGAEYESSANFFDLRFIPDDMEFDDEPKDMATRVPEKHRPADFTTQALQHSNVKLTWDQDDPERVLVTRRHLSKDDIDDMDFKAFLASGSSDDDSSDGEHTKESKLAERDRIRALLNLDKEDSSSSESEKEVEITFTPGLSESAPLEQTTEVPENETTLEKYMRKQREKRQRKKEAKLEKAAKEKAGGDDELVSGGELADEYANDPFFALSGGESDTENKPRKQENSTAPTKSKASKKSAGRVDKKTADAELELLVGDDGDDHKHFDLKEIMRAEKQKGKKAHKRKGKGRKREVDAEVTQDDFNLDTEDPRFNALFESHNFAIDPNSPHFKKTASMKKLLDTKRKKQRIA
ncbi:pre-rRNA-processing protein esf1 [Mycoemilia scoparia]|uniref:Pre-rRNA-processing protein esf1 n=1 Tax=Mycoemilia scoparia TaxID=417184 RepID=A0A9W8DQA5_9FUNG|nr:pre-rRNA-processing protein esf1 [Mycoemilia scoparia]